MSKNEAENANMKTEEQPVNTRELKKDEEPVEEVSAFSAEAMLEIAAINERSMSSSTKALRDKFVEFQRANPNMMIQNHDDFDLQIMFLPGSIPNEKPTGKADKYLPNVHLPGKVMIKCTSDPRTKLMMPVTFAIAVAHYMRPFLDAHPDAIKYTVALEKEIKMRKAEVDVFNLGK